MLRTVPSCGRGDTIATRRTSSRSRMKSRAPLSHARRVLLPSRVPRGRRAANAAANDAYLKGRHHRFNFTRGSLQRSLGFLQEAVTLDPDFAFARCDIAWTYLTLTVSGMMPTKETVERMRGEASQALALETSLPEAHTAIALTAVSDTAGRPPHRIPACSCGQSRVSRRPISLRAVVSDGSWSIRRGGRARGAGAD